MGRGGQIAWSIHLIPLDFFLGKFCKNKVYSSTMASPQHLQGRILETAGTFTQDALKCTRQLLLLQVGCMLSYKWSSYCN